MRVGVARATLYVSRVPLRVGDRGRRVRAGEKGADAGEAAPLPEDGAGRAQHTSDTQPGPRAEREHRPLPRKGGHRQMPHRFWDGEIEIRNTSWACGWGWFVGCVLVFA